MPRYYVYALLDPEQKRPRYIGKGLAHRTEAHFRQAQNLDADAKVIGVETEQVLREDAEQNPEEVDKQQWLRGLLDRGWTHAHIARVIARDLDEATALTLESFLIHHVYGQDNLFNVQAGHHAARFRPRGRWEPWTGPHGHDHYVYVLRDPRASAPLDGVFYVGQGSGNRLKQHFQNAAQAPAGDADPERLATIRDLMQQGLKQEQIGFIVAHVQSKQEAVLIEALLIKFLYGIHALTNQVAGHHAWTIRPKDSWDPLPGFDLPRVVDPERREDRTALLAILLAEGLNLSLDRVRERLNGTLSFDDYKVLDSGELGMEAPCEQTRIKAFTRRRRLQAELRPRLKSENTWMRAHFRRLGAEHLLRRDGVFIPVAWRGTRNMVDAADVLANRIGLLIEILKASQLNDLSEQAKALLGPPDEASGAEMPGGGGGPDAGGGGPEHARPNRRAHANDPEACRDGLSLIAERFPDIAFDEPRALNENEIAIEGLIGAEGKAPGAWLKVSCRAKGYGLKLGGGSEDQQLWLRAHIERLGGQVRRDGVFLPEDWSGQAGMEKTVETAVYRIGLLMRIVLITDPDELDDELRTVLRP